MSAAPRPLVFLLGPKSASHSYETQAGPLDLDRDRAYGEEESVAAGPACKTDRDKPRHANRIENARSLADDGGGHPRQMAGKGGRYGQGGRPARRDRNRQGDDGIRRDRQSGVEGTKG